MKKVLVLFAVAIALSTGALATSIVTLGTFSVSATSTFLQQDINDNCFSVLAAPVCDSTPTVIPVTPGEELQLIVNGEACYTAMTMNCHLQPLGGVFDTVATDLQPPTYQNRVPNQVPSGLANITDPDFDSWYGHYNTMIPDDFYICGLVAMMDCTSTSGTTVVVPAGAYYLYVGVLDSWYSDNVGDLSVTVNEIENPNTTPEPASAMLMLGGLCAAAAYHRRRAVQAKL